MSRGNINAKTFNYRYKHIKQCLLEMNDQLLDFTLLIYLFSLFSLYMGSNRCSLTLLCLKASMPVFTLKTVLMECFRGAHGPMKPLSSSKYAAKAVLPLWLGLNRDKWFLLAGGTDVSCGVLEKFSVRQLLSRLSPWHLTVAP